VGADSIPFSWQGRRAHAHDEFRVQARHQYGLRQHAPAHERDRHSLLRRLTQTPPVPWHIGLRLSDESQPAERPFRRGVVGDPDGRPVAFGWVDGDEHWLEVPGAATFRYLPGHPEIVAIPDAAGGNRLVEDAYLNLALPLAYQLSGLEALHASGARLAHGVVAFCARSGTGKTTVACGLWKRGHGRWADDAVVFKADDDPVVTYRIPFLANVRAETRAALDIDEVEAHEPGWSRESAPLAAVVLLERDPSGCPGVKAVRLPIAAALRELEPHAHRFNLGDLERKRRTMQAYLRLTARVPVLRARFAPGFDRFESVLDDLERAIGEVLHESG
jgi:hypothetical protein